ncbi:DUF4367 domain-containing protein [Clostridium sp. MCC353]|nr:DUF4367 domain-containing protein [Clostridium sp. MCC353]
MGTNGQTVIMRCSVDNNSKNNINDNSIDEKLKTAFGYSDEQLLAEFEAAEAQWKASPELQEELKAPEGEFDKILAMAHERRKEQEGKKKRHFRLRNAWKPLLAAALLGSLVLAQGIGGSAKRSYEYQKREEGSSNKIIWNNDDNLVKSSKSSDAYQQVQEQLGIRVISLDYLPEEMLFDVLTVRDNRAVLSFISEDHKLSLIEERNSSNNSVAVYTDTNTYLEVYNPLLDKDIIIRKNILEDGSVEYTADLSIDNAYYSLSGNLSEDDFVKVVKKLVFY